MRNLIRDGFCFAALCGVLSAGMLPAQTTTPAAGVRNGSATASTTKRRVRRKRVRTQTIPRETAPATAAPTTTSAAGQRAADAKLLQQQEARSRHDAQVTNAQVQKAQQRRDAQQNEIRIQDAPGPAQTGVVPAVGVPVQPGQDQRIQDQPSAVPGQNFPASTPPQR